MISMLQPTETEAGGGQARLTTKIVTKRLKSGEIKRYRYYQLVRTYRKGKAVKSDYIRYIGKEPPPRAHVAANQDQDPLDVAANQDRDMGSSDVAANQASALPDVAANRDAARPPPPLDLEVIEPEGKGFWSFPRYRATCRRCGRRFEMIQFEVELGHYLCPRCRAEIVNLGERSSWPGY